jgi:regulator of protease activity HflC (stomatin/prohibitin superfamily)
MTTAAILAALTALLIVLVFALRPLRQVVVADTEFALLIRDGRFERVLRTGRQWVAGFHVLVERHDRREKNLALPLQEITSADPASLKVSASVRWRMVDPERARASSANVLLDLYSLAQVALREAVGRRELEALLADRGAPSADLLAALAGPAQALGLEVTAAAVLDVVVRGELKDALGAAVQARAEARAKLERARGESAVLRHLANVAGLLESRLERLRLLEVAQGAAQSSGNSLVLHLGAEGAAGGLGVEPRAH